MNVDRDTRRHRSSRRAAVGAVVALALAIIAAPATAQDDEAPASFDAFAPCKSFSEELEAVNEESKKLEQKMPAKGATQNELLAAIFEGTQIMLGYGERMFEASDEFEESCKAALREADQPALIMGIYERVFEPTMRGYDFLVRIRDSAKTLNEEQTVADMNEAISGYKASARKLVEFCKDDLPEDATKHCDELSRRMDARMK